MPQPIALPVNLPDTVDRDVRRFAQNVAAIIDLPLAHLSYTVGAEAANVRRFTGQVRNRRGDPLTRAHIVQLWLSLTATGGPQNGQAVAFVSGTLLETIVANGEWRVESDTSGQIKLDVTIAGAATRYLRAFVIARADTSDAATWT